MGAARAAGSQQPQALGAASPVCCGVAGLVKRGAPGVWGWGRAAAGSTCGAEEEDGGLAQLPVRLVGHRGLSLRQGGEDVSVSLAHAGVNVVKEQSEGVAPHGSHLRAWARTAGIPGQQREGRQQGLDEPPPPGQGPGPRTGTVGRAAPAVSPRTRPSRSVGTRQPHSHGPSPGHGHICWRWWPSTAQGAANPLCWRFFTLLGEPGSAPPCTSLRCCPASSGAWPVPFLPQRCPCAVRHPGSPQLPVTVTGTARLSPGTPEVLPDMQQQEGFTDPTSLWGGHGAHAQAPVPLALEQRGKGRSTVPA